MKQLHPGAKWVFRFRVYPALIIILIWVIAGSATAIQNYNNNFLIYIVFIILFAIVLFIILGEIYARMAYKRWLYEFGNDDLKLERGIIWKKYSNIPYERVQNVDITRGIIARVCGFSTVNIQTAGLSYSPKGGMTVEGYIPGVPIQEAEHIREFVMKKITKKGRNQGL